MPTNTHAAGTRIGYVRVSTVAQTLDQQQTALESAGVTKMFSDTLSGARDDRPGLAELLAYVRDGDTVVVWKLDRLGRNLAHILATVKELTELGVTLVSVTDGIDSSRTAFCQRPSVDPSPSFKPTTCTGSVNAAPVGGVNTADLVPSPVPVGATTLSRR